ncbi:MAG: LbtU family siderophore porin [Deltaproteobacteria bacterium]|nr:LbtU family siderophore porin [Deltaproteobacteria bacterium]
MKKTITLPLILISLLLFATVTLASDPLDPQELQSRINILEQQLNDRQKQLNSQRQEIETNVQHISKHKRDIDGNREHLQEQEENLEKTHANHEQLAPFSESLKLIGKHLRIGGVVEVEIGFSEDYNDNNESDIVLATITLDIDIDLHKYVKAHILLLWEEDDTEPVDLDEAYILLGNTEHFPLYLQIGKLYLPFGNFESHMISDPLTLGLGESRESAVILGIDFNGLHASAYAFNGDINENRDDDEIKCFGLNAGYAFENETFNFDIGAGWINSIADSDGLTDALPGDIKNYVAGVTAHAIFFWQGLTLIGEYLGATDEFEVSELNFKGSGAEPKTWNIELGYTFEISGHETVIALAYQGSDEALALELPEERYLGSFGVGLADGLSLVVEYAHDEDYDEKDGGTGDNADTVTLRMALEF